MYFSKFVSQKTYWNVVGKIAPLDAVLDGYFEKEAFFETGLEVVKFFEREKLINKKSKTLQIGCGVGRIEKCLVKKVGECVGVDISESMIKQARQNVPNGKFVISDGKKLPFVDNYFDFIYSVLVFQHMPRSMFEANLKEVSRVLKPGGKFFFQIPLDEKGIKENPSESNPWLLRYYKRAGVEKLLKVYKFKILKTFYGYGKDTREPLMDNFSILVIR